MTTLAVPARVRGNAAVARQDAARADLRKRIFWFSLAYTTLVIAAVASILPFLYVLSVSFKESESLIEYPPRWIPDPLYFGNYVRMLTETSFPRWFFNTLFVACSVTAIKLVIDSMAGYAFAKMRFPLRESLFVLALSMLMIPLASTLLPMYLLVRWIGLQSTYPGIMLPALAAPMGVFLMRTFMEHLPRDLENAARLDGASEPYIFARIILPLCKPALVTLAIFTFLTQWVGFVWPLVIAPESDMYMLTTGLNSFKGQYRVQWGLVTSGMVLVLVPTAVVFTLFMRQFIAGTMAGALKQ